MIRLLRVILGAWRQSIRPAGNGASVIVTRPGWRGCFGHIFNPYPLPDGRWVVLMDVHNGSRYGPGGDSFAELYRWEFVIGGDDER